MSRRLVVTGVNGFVGQHLAKQAASDGWSVTGISTGPNPAPSITEHLDHYLEADLRHAWPENAPADAVVIHLAGLAAVGPSFDDPQAYLTGNSAMVTNLGEALLKAESTGRVIGVSTGAVYASNPQGSVHDETSPVAFNSPYAVSKILVENQLAYYRGRGLDTIIARPFNHIGPGQGPGFLIPDLTAKLRALAPGETLQTGNLNTRRDYTDVRDVANAYLALATAEHLPHTLYNVATGTNHSGHDILEAISKALGRETPATHTDPAKIRPNDPTTITGNATRLREHTAWRPVVEIHTTIADAIK